MELFRSRSGENEQDDLPAAARLDLEGRRTQASVCFPAQAVFRPSAKSKSIGGLYLAGSSTHPGGGVPSTIASGMMTSKLIARNE